jgi:hypothetical protein
VPAWYAVEKENVKRELEAVRDVAVTADGWSSVAQDHYLTVSVHYIIQGCKHMYDKKRELPEV